MEAVTDHVFREIIADIGKPDLMYTEFTSADALFSGGRKNTIERLKQSNKQKPVIAQIWGTTPESYFKATELIVELGFAGVDINMGCPARSVMKHKSGSALIKHPKLAAELIQACKDAAGNKIPVSVKTRIGIASNQTEKWISHLLEQNIDALTVHGRIAKNGSVDPANWDEIAKAVKLRDQIAPETVLIGNGDVLNIEDGLAKVKKYGVDGIMIGRGIFTNPWLFEKTPKEHTIEDYLDLMLRHTKLFVETWGEGKNFLIMRKFFKMYVREFSGAHELRKELMQQENFEEVKDVVTRYKKSLN